MYDVVKLKVECPYCLQQIEAECQFSELGDFFTTWRVGEYIGTDQYNYLTALSRCTQKSCDTLFAIRTKLPGSKSPKGFKLNVLLQHGVITGEYQVTEVNLPCSTDDQHLEPLRFSFPSPFYRLVEWPGE